MEYLPHTCSRCSQMLSQSLRMWRIWRSMNRQRNPIKKTICSTIPFKGELATSETASILKNGYFWDTQYLYSIRKTTAWLSLRNEKIDALHFIHWSEGSSFILRCEEVKFYEQEWNNLMIDVVKSKKDINDTRIDNLQRWRSDKKDHNAKVWMKFGNTT